MARIVVGHASRAERWKSGTRTVLKVWYCRVAANVKQNHGNVKKQPDRAGSVWDGSPSSVAYTSGSVLISRITCRRTAPGPGTHAVRTGSRRRANSCTG